jgi:hypothetical protein
MDHTIGDAEATNSERGEHDDDEEEEFMEVCHYGIKASPVGVDKT